VIKIGPGGFLLSESLVAPEVVPGKENRLLRDRVQGLQKESNRLFDLFWLPHAICNMASKASRHSLAECMKSRYWKRSPFFDVLGSIAKDQ
jgi:hypothetical protein